MNLFEFGWSGFWDPYIRWGGIIQLIILISNVCFLFRYIQNYFYTNTKFKEIQKSPVKPSEDKGLRAVIESEYHSNLKYYILYKICSKFLLNDLKNPRHKSFAKIIEISEDPELIMEKQIAKKSYGILLMGVLSLFVLVLFIIFASVFRVPYLLSTVELKDYHVYLSGPFQLFVLTSANFFISVCTFIQYQKFAKSISMMIQYLETKFFKAVD